jgi:hypothetical protein
VLGKLGALLNKDLGALVKDAGKVLNADVGTLAKGAGKVLNADLGTLLRDAEPGAVDTAALAAKNAATPAMPVSGHPAAAPAAVASAAAATATASPPLSTPPPGFDPDATLKLAPGDEKTLVLAPGGGGASSALPQLSDDLVLRHQRKMPAGTSLLLLLPHSAGEFERPHATPTGELTSDPVSAMYSVTGHPVAVRLLQCWDEEEARDHLNEIKVQTGRNFRMGDDRSWVLGETLQGLVFAWTRGNYAFTATAPKGEISMVRFLKAFPY